MGLTMRMASYIFRYTTKYQNDASVLLLIELSVR
jgi:hypothetical protein